MQIKLGGNVLSALDERDALLGEAAGGGIQFEWPQELGHLAEALPAGHELVDDIFSANHVAVAELLLDDGVVGDGDALLVNAGKAALVHQLANSLDIRSAVGDVCVHRAQHVKGCLVEAEEDAVVDLAQAQKLQNLAGLGVNTVDTAVQQ
jgi:hypothetical protein